MSTRSKANVRQAVRSTSRVVFPTVTRSKASAPVMMAESAPIPEPVTASVETPAASGTTAVSATAESVARPAAFSELRAGPKGSGGMPVAPLMDVHLKVSVILGETEMSLGDLLKLGEGSVIELNNSTGEPILILVNERPYAKGDIVVVEDVFGVRISEILDPQKKV